MDLSEMIYPENLRSRGNAVMPDILFENGKLEIKGNSLPEDTDEFYRPVLNWVNDYLYSDYVKNEENQTTFVSKMGYFNTRSRSYILEIVSKMNELQKSGHEVHFIWYYEKEESFEEDIGIKFEDLIDDFVLKIEYLKMD